LDIIAPMTDRGLPIVDGAPACPFVAFEDDRDGRATAPDHGHRCFAEPRPAPRALAHQEAYCLASAFPVCPTFQDWARREAAAARPSHSEARDADEQGPGSRPMPPRELEARHVNESDTPLPVPPRRNPPRDWAAPPPWSVEPPPASGWATPGQPAGGPPASGYPSERDTRRATDAAAWGAASAGLAGSAADRLAGPGWDEPIPPSAVGASAHEHGPDEAYAPYGGRDAGQAPAPPPPGRAAAASRQPARRPSNDPSDLFGPAWERPRRYEAYPSLRTRVGLPGFGRPSGIAIAAISLVLAAAGLFFVGPMLLGIGGDDDGTDRESPTPRAEATATPLPTPVPEPTPQVHIVAKKETLSKIAKKYGITLEELLAANPQIKNPNRIDIGDEITIPVPVEDAGGTGAEGGEEAPPSEVP
jgi:hypothetical protein